MKKIKCNVCNNRYKADKGKCPFCFSKKAESILYKSDELFMYNVNKIPRTARCTITITNERLIVFERREIWHGFIPLSVVIILLAGWYERVLFEEKIENIYEVTNEKKRNLFTEVTLSVIKMYNDNEYCFAPFDVKKLATVLKTLHE